MTRRYAIDLILNHIKKHGFTPREVLFAPNYLKCEFNIKGLMRWKFVISTRDTNGYIEICFYANHKLNHSFEPYKIFYTEYDHEDLLQAEKSSGVLYEVTDILNMIKRHPFVAFTMDSVNDKYYDKSYVMCYMKMLCLRTMQKNHKIIQESWR